MLTLTLNCWIFLEQVGIFRFHEEEINIGISMKKGNTELQEAINSVLAEMTPEDFDQMMDDAIAVQPLSE